MAGQRFVQLYTWWITPGGKRQFCVVDKTGKYLPVKRADGSTDHIYSTTDVKLVEVLNPNPINYEIAKFWDLVDRGKLIEYIPGVTVIEATQEAKTETPWHNPENAVFEAASR